MTRLSLPLLFVTVALSACASTPAPEPKEQLAAAKDKDVYCEREIQVGTAFPKVKCRSAQQVEAERAEAAKLADAIRLKPHSPKGPAGGQ